MFANTTKILCKTGWERLDEIYEKKKNIEVRYYCIENDKLKGAEDTGEFFPAKINYYGFTGKIFQLIAGKNGNIIYFVPNQLVLSFGDDGFKTQKLKKIADKNFDLLKITYDYKIINIPAIIRKEIFTGGLYSVKKERSVSGFDKNKIYCYLAEQDKVDFLVPIE